MENFPQLSGDLFNEVQTKRIFTDSKTFVDSICKINPRDILDIYNKSKNNSDFDLTTFIQTYFQLPDFTSTSTAILSTPQSLNTYITFLWDTLFRKPDSIVSGMTLIPLPYGYIVPGGRFREIYYWDSFFTSLGLIKSGKVDSLIDMCKNFVYLIDTVGHIPNGNRLYYITRSQPPFFYKMVELLTTRDPHSIETYLPALEKEYSYWMQGTSFLKDVGDTHVHVVKISEQFIANRYFDTQQTPRAESFHIDVSNGLMLPEHKRSQFYQHIRAAAESGWDFSSRWLTDPLSLISISTTDILPIDLNCLLFGMETSLSQWNKELGNDLKAIEFAQQAIKRKQMIQELFWSDTNQFYFDYHYKHKKQTNCWSLAAVFPLYVNLATKEQATYVAAVLKDKFLKEGGLITTCTHSPEQWDAPNGWPPLMWIAIQGLQNYGFTELAQEIKNRLLRTIEYQYNNTGFVFEKYNVENPTVIASGGEYPVQLGFGWTNGVYLDLLPTTEFP